MDIKLNKKAIEEGQAFFFETKDKEDLRVAEIGFDDRDQFVIFFNGACIHISRTFKSLQNRFDKLNTKWDLEPAKPEEKP